MGDGIAIAAILIPLAVAMFKGRRVSKSDTLRGSSVELDVATLKAKIDHLSERLTELRSDFRELTVIVRREFSDE